MHVPIGSSVLIFAHIDLFSLLISRSLFSLACKGQKEAEHKGRAQYNLVQLQKIGCIHLHHKYNTFFLLTLLHSISMCTHQQNTVNDASC